MSGGEGTVAAFAIEDGRIHCAPIAAHGGMEVVLLVNQRASFGAR